MFPSNLELEKLVPSYFEPHKHCCSYLEREKSGSLLFGDQKMYLTTVRSKEKDYDIYLKSEKLVHSQQEHEKNVSQLFGIGKTGSQLFRASQTLLQLFLERKSESLLFGDKKIQCIPVIWRPKNIVHNCRSKEKVYDIYLKSEKLVDSQQEHEKNVPSYLEVDKTGSQLF